MKYLKEYNHKKDYIEISEGEYISYKDDSKKLDMFSNTELKAIQTILPSAKLNSFSKNIFLYNIIDIYKDNDEWYYIDICIHFNGYYYKCDQFEGLMDCLNMLQNKYKHKLY